MSQLVQLEMPDGQLVWAVVEAQHGPGDVGVSEAVVEKLHGFTESLSALAVNARSAVAAARPQEASVEFGLELSVGKDGVFAALVGAGGKAAVKVTLKWAGDRSRSESAVGGEPGPDQPYTA
jgi:Trypsin-co-occurring domain 1